MGMMELGVTFSLVQLIVDDIIVNDIKKMITSDLGDSLVSGSDWLSGLTEKGFPSRLWSPHRVRGRVFPDNGRKSFSGKSNIIAEATQRVQTILTNHRPKPLPQTVVKRIREIIVEAEERRM